MRALMEVASNPNREDYLLDQRHHTMLWKIRRLDCLIEIIMAIIPDMI